MHEEHQPPEYQSAWSASQDPSDGQVRPADGAAGQAQPVDAPGASPEPGALPEADAAQVPSASPEPTDAPAPGEAQSPTFAPSASSEAPGSQDPAAPPLPAGNVENPTMIYAPPGSYLPPGADEPGAGDGYGAPGGYGAGGYGPGQAGQDFGGAGYASGAEYGGGGYGNAGYGNAGYGNAGYGNAGYGGPGYGSGDYGSAGYGSGGYGPGGPYPPGVPYPPGGPYPPSGGYGMPGDIIGGGYGPPRPPRRGSRILTYVVVAALAAGVGAGTVLALNHNSGNSSPSLSFPSAGGVPNPGSGSGSGSGSTNASNSVARAVKKKVSPGIVDVISTPRYSSGTLEGTGMILNGSGLILTNNHVIEGTSSWKVRIPSTGRIYSATVIGEDKTDDVALIKVSNASGLTPVPLGNSQSAHVGDAVIALGNANGADASPSMVTGVIKGLDQSIKATDQGAGTTENLQHMIETNAPIVSGDSGGALANTHGQVIGMNTAANGGGSPLGGGQGTSLGFAIPIDRALSIAQLIADGKGNARIQIGLPAFLGVTVARSASGNGSSTTTSPSGQLQELQKAAQQGGGFGGFGGGSGTGGNGQCLTSNDSLSVPTHIANVSSGALISGVLCQTPVAGAGLTAGSVITGINGNTIDSPATLTQQLSHLHPGTTISITWVAPNNQQHTSQLKLASGPAQ